MFLDWTQLAHSGVLETRQHLRGTNETFFPTDPTAQVRGEPRDYFDRLSD